jgi:hypothetical protein
MIGFGRTTYIECIGALYKVFFGRLRQRIYVADPGPRRPGEAS